MAGYVCVQESSVPLADAATLISSLRLLVSAAYEELAFQICGESSFIAIYSRIR